MDGNNGITGIGPQPVSGTASQQSSNAVNAKQPGNFGIRQVFSVPPDRSISMSIMTPPGSFVKVDVSDRYVAVTTVNTAYLSPPMSPEARQILFDQGVATLAEVKGYTIEEAANMVERGMAWAETGYGPNDRKVENAFMGWVNNAPDRSDNPNFRTADDTQASSDLQKFETQTTTSGYTKTAVAKEVAEQVAEQVAEEVTEVEGNSESTADDILPTAVNTTAMPDGSMSTDFNTSDSRAGTNDGDSQQEPSVSTQPVETGDSTDGNHTAPDADPGSVTRVEDSGKSATVDHPTTDTNTMASSEASELVDINTSVWGAGINEGGTQPVQQESTVSTQPVATGDSIDGDHTGPNAGPGSVTKAEDSGKSATVDHPTTDTNTMASSEASERVDINTSVGWAGINKGGMQPVLQESTVSTQTMETGDSTDGDYTDPDAGPGLVTGAENSNESTTKTAVAEQVAEQAAEDVTEKVAVEVTEVEGDSESTGDDILPTAIDTTAMPDGSMPTDFNTSDSRAGTNDGDSQQESSVSTQPVETGDSADGDHTDPDADPGSVTRAEDSGKSATVDHPTTDTNTMASSEASERVDINTSVGGAGINEGVTQPVQQESTVSTQTMETGDSTDGDYTDPDAGPGLVTGAENSNESTTKTAVAEQVAEQAAEDVTEKVALEVTEVEGDSESTADDNLPTAIDTMAMPDGSIPTDFNTSDSRAGTNDGDSQQESSVSTQPVETGDSADGGHTDPDADPGSVTRAEDSGKSATVDHPTTDTNTMASSEASEGVDINTSVGGAGINEGGMQPVLQESTVSTQAMENGDSTDGDYTDPDAGLGLVTGAENSNESTTKTAVAEQAVEDVTEKVAVEVTEVEGDSESTADDNLPTAIDTMAMPDGSIPTDFNTSDSRAGTNDGDSQQESSVSTQPVETGASADGDHTDPDADPGSVTRAEDSGKSAIADHPTTDTNTMASSEASEPVNTNASISVAGTRDAQTTQQESIISPISPVLISPLASEVSFPSVISNQSEERPETASLDNLQETTVSNERNGLSDEKLSGQLDESPADASESSSESLSESAVLHETSLQRSDDTDRLSPETLSEEAEFTTGKTGTSDSPEPIDSGYYPDDDQYGMPTLRPETPTNTGSPMNPGEEPATVDRAAEISNNSVSMAEIAQRRVKERPQFSPSQTSSIDYSPARGSKRKFSRLDWSYVESSGYGQDSKRMKISPKKISTKQRQEWTNDANFLGASTHNKLALAKEVYAKLKKNMSDLSQSKIIIETNRKYISAEGATKAPAFLQSPGKKQLAALNELGLDRHASENAILLALIDKASESIEANKNSKKHENTMLNLNKIHQDLFGET